MPYENLASKRLKFDHDQRGAFLGYITQRNQSIAKATDYASTAPQLYLAHSHTATAVEATLYLEADNSVCINKNINISDNIPPHSD